MKKYALIKFMRQGERVERGLLISRWGWAEVSRDHTWSEAKALVSKDKALRIVGGK